jgi:hypothetical protein
MMETGTSSLPVLLDRVQRRALVIGAAGAVALLAGFFVDRVQFHRSWLLAWLFWLAPSIGSLAVVMLHHLTGGAWGFAVRRVLEGASRTLPWMALLFLPVLLGIDRVYEWAGEGARSADPLIAHKAAYLNAPFFVARAVGYFAVWIALATIQARLSWRYDHQPHPRIRRSLQKLSGAGLVLYVLTTTFASVDWAMSLEPRWSSTIYGLHFVVGQVLTTLCLAVVAASELARREPYSRWLSPAHFHDLGNLMLAFVLLWAYVSFSQFLIIWSGDLPEEIPWYVHRSSGGWQAIAIVLALFHFFAPFAVLLSRGAKRSGRTLARLALVLLVLRFVDLYWLIVPAFQQRGFSLSWMDVVAPLTLGGLWIGCFVRALRGKPLISLQDARLHSELERAPAP